MKEERDEYVLGYSYEGGIGWRFDSVLVVDWHFFDRIEFEKIDSSCFDQTLQRCVLAFIALSVEQLMDVLEDKGQHLYSSIGGN